MGGRHPGGHRAGATDPVVGVGAGAALGYEIVLTATPMLVIMAVDIDTRAVGMIAVIAIGGTVALDGRYRGSVTGALDIVAKSGYDRSPI
jgi:Major intrinsic protein